MTLKDEIAQYLRNTVDIPQSNRAKAIIRMVEKAGLITPSGDPLFDLLKEAYILRGRVVLAYRDGYDVPVSVGRVTAVQVGANAVYITILSGLSGKSEATDWHYATILANGMVNRNNTFKEIEL